MGSNTKARSFEQALPQNSDGLNEVKLDEAHSPLKILKHQQLVRDFAEGQAFNPIHMRIGITGACNMRCDFCNFHSPNEASFYDAFSYSDSISTDEAVKLLESFAHSGGRAVTFCGSGECTVHSGYADICEAANAAGLRIGLITNGSRLDRPEIADAVIKNHTWVRIGMNAGEDETFAKITHQRKGTFTRILGSIRRLRQEAKEPEFRIGLNYVVTQDNADEIRTAAALAKKSGAHYVRFEPEFYSHMGHETISDRISHIASELEFVQSFADDDFEVSTPKLDRGPMDHTDEIEGHFDRCHYSRFVTAVGADGHLYPCPQVHLNNRYKIGDVIEGGYEEVLNGGPREDWEHSNPLRTDLCKTCFYRPQNELLQQLKDGTLDPEKALIEYALEVPKTLHADFV